MRVEEVAGYLERVPIYRQLSERFLDPAGAPLAEWLLPELARGGAIAIAGGVVRAKLPA
jgi:hypothetical protein